LYKSVEYLSEQKKNVTRNQFGSWTRKALFARLFAECFWRQVSSICECE